MSPKIEKELKTLETHTARIEAEQDWETSLLRISIICIAVYASTAIMFFTIGVDNYLLSALIPTTSFFVSNLGLPPIKKWWIDKKVKTFIIVDKEDL